MFHTLGEIKNRASYAEHETQQRIDAEAEVLRTADRVICATEQERTSRKPLRARRWWRHTSVGSLFPPRRKTRASPGLKDEKIILFACASSR
jgi:hypothetical protein